MLTLVLVAALAQGGDAGDGAGGDSDAGDAGVEPPNTNIYGSCPEVEYTDGGSAPVAFPAELDEHRVLRELLPDAGATSSWYLPYPRPQRLACKLAACEERNGEMEQWRKPTMVWLIVSAAVSAAILAAVVTYEICSKLPICGSH